MRKLVITGMLFSVALVSVGQEKVSANAALDLALAGTEDLQTQPFINAINVAAPKPAAPATETEIDQAKTEPTEQQKTEYIVQKGDSLTKIASLYKTTWRRIYDKNTVVEDPDHLLPGTALVIPLEDEVLESRSLPEPPPVVVVPAQTPSAKPRTAPAATTRGSSDGNRYVAGYCTWYVKNRRPDLPNNLGNAITWVSRAAAQGLPTGSTPVAGAVGQKGNHVVYVESVNGDGTINISDMNYKGLYVITHRTVPANQFSYIY